ncbi:undecaprenyl-diphosphate phosphatase [Brevundimonas sp.]|uniref:undecaprenyl-diphosphate phosphatase n=1 Tax=Brevundimonas sp. TaxID=1871086 RepID=UPI002D28E492|nr:undecaprenyl-diphosphate phosphatase [Brevundimonas sp.]HYC74071.1 undecaprenyl-diphosphate phosphatase [Brevundimonas sp.]
MADWLAAIILGLVEGLTEFIPVSSTGHLLLAKQALGLGDEPWDTFIVMIQLGAILAVVALYFQRLWKVLIGLPGKDPAARMFALSVLLAFIPSAIIGLLFHDFIKDVLFNTTIVCITLIVGGFALIALERWAPVPREHDAMKFSWKTALGVGLFQCLSIIPGVSRSGATIVGGLLLGVEKRAAAEFSFFLAIPTMVAAFGLDFWESREMITSDVAGIIGIGFVVSFVSGLFIVRFLIDFVGRYGFAPFAAWRILVGTLGLLGMWLYA